MPQVTLTVNGQTHTAEVEGRTLLVELLRETLRLTGTHGGFQIFIDGIFQRHFEFSRGLNPDRP